MGHQRDLALSARSFLRPVTSRRIPLNPDLGYWGGVTWAARLVGTCSNAAHDIQITPGEGNEFEFLYGMHFFTAAGARTFQINILDANGDLLAHMQDALNYNTGVRVPIPYGATRHPLGDAGSLPVSRWIISGDMVLQFSFASMLVTETTTTSLVCRVRGEPPTITPADAYTTFDITMDRFY